MALENIITHIASAEVTWDFGGTPVVLTPAMGGVTLKSAQSVVEVKQDGEGDAPIDHVTKGKVASLDMNLSAMDLDRIVLAAYGCTLSTLEHHMSNKVGNSLRAEAKVVLIKPLVDGIASTDETSWITIPLCSPPVETLELVMDDENQKTWACTMFMYPHTATGFARVLWYTGVYV